MKKISCLSLPLILSIVRAVLSDSSKELDTQAINAAIGNWTAAITAESSLTQEIKKVVEMYDSPDCSAKFDQSEPVYSDFMNSLGSASEMLDKKRAEMDELTDKYIRQIVSSSIHVAALRGNAEVASYLLGMNGDPYLTDAQGRTPLHIAASNGNLTIAELILNKTAVGINMRDRFNATALFLASYNNRSEICDLLLRFGADPEIPVMDGRTALHPSAKKGHLSIVILLITNKRGIINVADVNGDTALHTAAANNRYNVTKLLLEQGADPQATNKIESTPLHLAAGRGHRDIVDVITCNDTLVVNMETDESETALNLAVFRNHSDVFNLLMSRGADPNIPTKGLTYPLHFAAYNDNVDILKYLLSLKGVNINVQDKEGRSPLHLATTFEKRNSLEYLLSNNASAIIPRYSDGATPIHVAVIKKNIQIIKLILSYSPNSINTVDKDNMTALYYATRYNYSAISSLLLESGADPYIPDKFGNTPLIFAVKKNNKGILDHILSKSLEGINLQNVYGHTALHKAVDQGKIGFVKTLLDHGANPYLGDKNKWTTLHFAVNNNDFVSSALIVSKNNSGIDYKSRYGYTPLWMLAARGNNDTKLYKLLLDYGADPFVQNKWSGTLLHLVSDIDNVQVADLVLKSKNYINVQSYDGVTPLIYAVGLNRMWLTKYFLEKGADPNIPDVYGRVALHYAAQKGNVQMAEILLDNNATITNPQDVNGSTPLFNAEVYGHEDMFLFLLGRGADPNLKTYRGQTILHWIAQDGKLNMAMRLIGNVNVNEVDNNGVTPIMMALFNNHSILFNFLLHAGGDPNIPDATGMTCLLLATFSCFSECIEAIVEKTKESLNIPDYLGDTPLMKSIEMNCTSTEYLLQQGADPFEKNANGHMAIHMAALYGNIEASNLLLNIPGVSIDSVDITYYTPLTLAAMYGNTDMVLHLLERGANPCIISKLNTSILLYACDWDIEIFKKIYTEVAKKCNGKEELVRQEAQGSSTLSCAADSGKEDVFFYVIEKGANPFVLSYQGKSLLHSATVGGNLNIINYLITNASVPVNSLTMAGETPLMLAARRGNKRAFDMLSKLGGDRSCITKYGETLLHSAAYGGSVEIMEELLKESDINIDSTDFEGNTPLMYAVKEQQVDMTNYLLQNNVDALAKNSYGEDALRWAAFSGNFDLIFKFPQTFESIDSLLGIIISSNNVRLKPDTLGFLLERSTLANNSLFIAAAKGDDRKLFRLFQQERKLEKKGFPNLLREFTKEYEDLLEDVLEEEQHFPSYRASLSPLDVAILFFGQISTVKILIEKLNINITEIKKKSLWTPLELACVSTGLYDAQTTLRKESVFLYLLNNAKSLLNHTDKFGWNIVHKAAWVGNSKIIYTLYKNGADINKLDNYGRTPLHIAALKGFHFTVKNLLYLSDKCVNCYDIYGFTPLHLTQIFRIQKFFKKYSQTTITLDTGLRYKLLQQVDLIGKYQKSLRPQDHLSTMSVLLRAKADINIQDKAFHWTPLHWAAASGDFNTTSFLVSRGAKINIPSKRGQTPMYLARYWGRKDIYYYLKSVNGIW